MNGVDNKDDLVLGFDLSTQSLKSVALDCKLGVFAEFTVVFESDLSHFKHNNGVLRDGDRVYTDVRLWIEALDLLLCRMQAANFPFSRVRSISGAGQVCLMLVYLATWACFLVFERRRHATDPGFKAQVVGSNWCGLFQLPLFAELAGLYSS